MKWLTIGDFVFCKTLSFYARLHTSNAEYCYRNSVSLSVCQMRGLWQNEIIVCQYVHTIQKKNLCSFFNCNGSCCGRSPSTRHIGWNWPTPFKKRRVPHRLLSATKRCPSVIGSRCPMCIYDLQLATQLIMMLHIQSAMMSYVSVCWFLL